MAECLWGAAGFSFYGGKMSAAVMPMASHALCRVRGVLCSLDSGCMDWLG